MEENRWKLRRGIEETKSRAPARGGVTGAGEEGPRQVAAAPVHVTGAGAWAAVARSPGPT